MRNMTEGSVLRHLLSYSVPLVFGNVLQLTYNAVDSILISKGAGLGALSAVSVSNPVSALMIQGISGIGIGASVYMSKFYGGGEWKKLKSALASTILFGTVFSALIILLGLPAAGMVLRAMNVPAEIFQEALLYLRIILIGNIFVFQYNILSSALRAVGDSRTPVYFAALSSILNAVLDAVFIFILHWGVFGAALATVMAEAASALLCYRYVYRHIPELRLKAEDLRFDLGILKRILSGGLVTALQQSAQPVGMLLIHSVVNTQGVDVIAAFHSANRIEDYGRIPAQTISHGMMTCTAQNRGAGKLARTGETLRKGILLGLIYYPLICILILLFRVPLMKMFTPEDGGEAMLSIGVSYLSVKALNLIFPCLTNAIQGYFRGMNRMLLTLLATLLQISVRTVCVYLLVPRIGIRGEAYACAIGWTAMLLFEYGYYFLVFRKRIYGCVSGRTAVGRWRDKTDFEK